MIRLAHLSDIHLGPLPPVSVSELMGKRLTGYLNWRFSRGHALKRDTLAGLIAHLKQTAPDLIAVTGDLVNIAVKAEFEMSARWLQSLGPPQKVAVIPGNHDIYVPGAMAMAEAAWGDYMRGQTLDDTSVFPFVRLAGDVALIACNSAVPRPAFFASGRFGADQGRRLAEGLKKLGERGLFRAVLIHHPPTAKLAGDLWRGLTGAHYFREAIREAGAELILHGHMHTTLFDALPGPDRDVPVLGIAAASSDATSGGEPARYNLFEIERVGTGFSCTLSEYGYQRIGDGVVRRLRMQLD